MMNGVRKIVCTLLPMGVLLGIAMIICLASAGTIFDKTNPLIHIMPSMIASINTCPITNFHLATEDLLRTV